MATMVESYRQLYSRRRDDLLAEILPAGAAYDHAQKCGKLSRQGLAAIVTAACHQRRLVAMNACELLTALSTRWPELTSRAVLDLFANPQAQARFAAICSLTKHTDEGVIADVLRRGLNDKSASVRWNAAQTAERLDRSDLLPNIAEAIERERIAKTRKSLEYSHKMLRDGYIVDSEAEGRVSIWIRTSVGWSGRQVDATAIKEHGLEAVVAELRKSK